MNAGTGQNRPDWMRLDNLLQGLYLIGVPFATFLAFFQQPNADDDLVFISELWIASNIPAAIFFAAQVASQQISNRKVVIFRLTKLAFYVFATIQVYAYLYYVKGLQDTLLNRPVRTPLTSLYFSVVTWTTVGYGDVIPLPGLCRAFAAAEAFTGYVLMAVAIAAFINLYKSFDS